MDDRTRHMRPLPPLRPEREVTPETTGTIGDVSATFSGGVGAMTGAAVATAPGSPTKEMLSCARSY